MVGGVFQFHPNKDQTDIMVRERQIIPGISITDSGHASVAPELADVLFDLALMLEEPTNLPVDVEHVLAAIIMAVNQGDLDTNTALTTSDPTLVAILEKYVKTVFAETNGNVCQDD